MTVLIQVEDLHRSELFKIEEVDDNGNSFINSFILNNSSNLNNELLIFTLPKELDVDTVDRDIQKLRDIIVLEKDEISPLKNCSPTTQIKMYQRKIQGSTSWFIQSINEKGEEKKIGGDEFYIEYTDWDPQHEDKQDVEDGIEPDAVAMIHDFQNGTYQLDFVSTPMKTANHKTSLSSSPYFQQQKEEFKEQKKGRIKVYFEYTCGIGNMPQPTKENWKASGMMYQKPLYHDNFPRPPIKIFQPPTIPTSSRKLSTYSSVVFFGDSTMYQLAVKHLDPKNGQKVFFRPNIIYTNNVRSQLTKERMKKYFLRKLFIFHNKELRDLENVALLMGSSIWDLLIGDNTIQGTDYKDHLEACKILIELVKERYPKVDIFWKGTSALHPHRVNCVEANYEYQDCLNSTKYLSNSRVQNLELKQRLLMKELKIPYLDVYPAYYLSAYYMTPGDGRHSTPILNEQILKWFFD